MTKIILVRIWLKIITRIIESYHSLFSERSALDHNPVLGCNSSSYLLTHYFITQMLRPTRSVAFEAGYDVEGITRRILL